MTHMWDLQLKTKASLVILGFFRIRSHTMGEIQPMGQIRSSLQTRFSKNNMLTMPHACHHVRRPLFALTKVLLWRQERRCVTNSDMYPQEKLY